MSNQAWLIFVTLSFGALLIIAGMTAKTLRYRYGLRKIPRVVGDILFVGLGLICVWIAVELALKP